MSIESFKASFSKSVDEGEATLQKEGITEKKQEVKWMAGWPGVQESRNTV